MRLLHDRNNGLLAQASLLLGTLFTCFQLEAQVPGLLSYQGRIQVNGTPFSGTGRFKFALVDATGNQAYWGNWAGANSDGQPDSNVVATVTSGIFTVMLGDTNLAGMSGLPPAVFTNNPVFLRIWFNDGTNGIQKLTPDQPVSSSAYAMMAGNVTDGSITLAKLAANSGVTVSSANPQDASLVSKGFAPFSTIPSVPWFTSSSLDNPTPKSGQSSIWTGQELLVWGGNSGSVQYATGSRYRPDLDQWQLISTVNAPDPRDQQSAVWTGLEMIIWGGNTSGVYVNTGGRFNPSNQVWTAMTTNGAPAGRFGHVAIWTGTRLVIVGGRNSNGLLADAAIYDPTANTWTTVSLPNAPSARAYATAVWTGSKLILWGGSDATGGLNTGAQLAFSGNAPTAWTPTGTANAPTGRVGHSALWTGQYLLIWGGANGGARLGDGAAYDPAANTWTTLTSSGAPTARSAHAAVWTGQEMLVFGGETSNGTSGDGAAYNPTANTWRPLSTAGNPDARSGAACAWTGTALLLFGGFQNGTPLASLQSLNPQPTWYLYRKP